MYGSIGICSVFKWCIFLKASLLLLCDLLPTNFTELVIYQPLLFGVRKRLMLYGSISVPVWHMEYNILPKRGRMSATWQFITSPSAPWQMHFSFFHQTTCEYCYIVQSFSLLLLHKRLWKPENATSAGCRIRRNGSFWQGEAIIACSSWFQQDTWYLKRRTWAMVSTTDSQQGWESQAKHAPVGCQVCAENMQMCQQMLQVFSFLPCPTVISSAIGMAQLTWSPWSSAISATAEE